MSSNAPESMANAPLSPESYTIGIICALPLEKAAVDAMMDEENPGLDQQIGDENAYTFGRIGKHNVVAACLPAGEYGKVSAAAVAKDMKRSFPTIRAGLMVGIGGGVWSKKHDIRLGDVVVSQPEGTHGGVVQYDLGKAEAGGGFRRKGFLNSPPSELSTALSKLQATHRRKYDLVQDYVKTMGQNNPRMVKDFGYVHQGVDSDKLFTANYIHPTEQENCGQCGTHADQIVRRSARQDTRPNIHYGTIASGDQVMKDGIKRDSIAKEQGVICFEMEAAGLMNHFPCSVIRGISDYADSHKNDSWQPYAAATAAAYAKESSGVINPAAVSELPTIGNKHWTMPRKTNNLFTGRTAILNSMNEASLPPRTTPSETSQRVFVLVGMGGSGKSESAIKFAEMHRERFWGVFWVDADTPQSTESGFRKIAETCKLLKPGIDDVREWLANTKESWSLISDNCDDPEVKYNKYFPPAQRGTVIITTRVSECEGHGISKRMDEMEHQDGIELLLKACRILGVERDNVVRTQAERVANLLGFHALALVHAGAYIGSRLCTSEEYPQVYSRQQREVLEHEAGQISTRFGSVYDTLEVSARALEVASLQDDTSASALRLSEVSAFVHRDNVQEKIFKRASEWIPECERALGSHMQNEVHYLSSWHISQATCTGLLESFPSRFRKARAKLAQSSSVTLSAESCISLHPLVHEWARIRSDRNATGEAWTKAACILALSIKNDWEWNELITASQPHLETCYKLWPADEWQDEIPLPLDLGRIFYAFYWQLYRADSSEALPLAQMLSDRSRSDPESRTARYRYIDYIVANRLIDNDQLQEAADLLEKIVDARKTLEASDADRLTAQRALASLYSRLGEHQKAITLLGEVVQIQETTLAPKHPHQLASQHDLAHAYSDTGEYQKAITLFEEVVRIRETTLKPEHPNRLQPQHELAFAYSRTGEYQKAITLLEEVVRIRETTLKPEHPNRLASQHELARAYSGTGEYQKAITLLEEVVRIKEITLKPEHPERSKSQYNLAWNYVEVCRYEKAKEELEKVVEIRQRILKPEDHDSLSSQHALAWQYAELRQYEKAKELIEKVVEIRQRILKSDDPHRISSEKELDYVNKRSNETRAAPAAADRAQTPSRPPPMEEMGTSAATSTTELPIRSKHARRRRGKKQKRSKG